MLFRFTPQKDDRAALEFEDLASQLDAGLSPAQVGGDAADGEQLVHGILARRRIDLDPTEAAVLTAAWRAGRTSASLRHLAAQRRQRADGARILLRGFRYPLALTGMALVTSFAAGGIAGRSLFITVLAAVIGIAVLLRLGITGLARGREPWVSLPFLRGFARALAEVPYLEVLHGLYASGVPLLRAHPLAVAACPVVAVQRDLQQADQLLQQGQPLAKALGAVAVDGGGVHRETLQLIASGEPSGSLEEALLRALRRRQEVGARHMAGLAKGLSMLVYVLACAVAITVVFSFYSSYFGALRAIGR
jgi:type II secretory pathway component PulF